MASSGSQETKAATAELTSFDEGDTVVIGQPDAMPQTSDEEAMLLEWLQPTSYESDASDYKKHLSYHIAGTGDRLWQAPSLVSWHDTDGQGLLCIKGNPGSGKSVLAASLVKKLRQDGTPVIFSFLKNTTNHENLAQAILRDWLAQLLPHSRPLRAHLASYANTWQKAEVRDGLDLLYDLDIAIEDLPKIYCVVDGVDEIGPNCEEFLSTLTKIQAERPSRMKVILTTRPGEAMELVLQEFNTHEVCLSGVEQNFVKEDIEKYVNSRLGQSIHPGLSHGQRKDEIRQLICSRAQGSFLYARLAMDALAGTKPQQTAESLPKSVEDMYTELLRSHAKTCSAPPNLRMLVPLLVAHAPRPLRLLEVADMVSVTQDTGSYGGEDAVKDLIRNACGAIVEVLSDGTLWLTHQSLADFLSDLNVLSSQPEISFGNTQSQLAHVCVTYLLRSDGLGHVSGIEDPYDASSWEDPSAGVRKATNNALLSRYPFLSYATKEWHNHSRKAGNAMQLPESLLCDIDQLLCGPSLPALMTLCHTQNRRRTPLNVAARFGLHQSVPRLFKRPGVDPDAQDDFGSTALIEAVVWEYLDTIKVLIQYGADPEAPDASGLKPIHVAAEGNLADALDLLLSLGVDPMSGVEEGGLSMGESALYIAMRKGREEAARALIPYLNEETLVDQSLAWAIEGGHEGIVLALLNHPLVDVNRKIKEDRPLFLAAKAPSVDIMIALLESGADPCLKSWWMSPENNKGQLVNRGEPFSGWERSRQGFNPLHALSGACRQYLLDVPESAALQSCMVLMLGGGIDVNARDETGSTALHYATWSPQLQAILQGVGAEDVAGTGLRGLGETAMAPVMDALRMELGMQYLSSSTTRDHDGRGVLHLFLDKLQTSAGPSALEITDALLAAGAPPDLRDNGGRAPLHLVRVLSDKNEYRAVVQRLIAAGADLNALDHSGRTPIFNVLHCPVLPGEKAQAIEILAHLGAQFDARDFSGRNLLFACIEQYVNRDVLTDLVKRGLDPASRDNFGNTLWHAAARHRAWLDPIKDVNAFSDLGIDPNATNNAGILPLHLLADTGFRRLDVASVFAFIDIKDNNGIRPLHIACRSCERDVSILLSAGADPTGPTHDGMTPLHVAARFREPNIVGMLLKAIETRIGRDGVVQHLNKFYQPTTPPILHLACQSGLPETVALVLTAGADPNLHNAHVPPPIMSCAKFEEEDALWQSHKRLRALSVGGLGVGLADPFRPSTRGQHELLWIEKILSLLYGYGADFIDSKDEKCQTWLLKAILASHGRDYTIECLVNFHKQISTNNVPDVEDVDLAVYAEEILIKEITVQQQAYGHSIISSIFRRKVGDQALRLMLPLTGERNINDPLFGQMADRQWGCVRQILEFEAKSSTGGVISIESMATMVSYGLDSLLSSYLRQDTMREMDKRHEGLFEGTSDVATASRAVHSMPLLLTACYRDISNMAILRHLVQGLGANVNVQEAVRGSKPHTLERDKGALHALIAGGCWWQVMEALPYLISQGADTELRDESGNTALLSALKRGRHGVDAARVLVEHGADVNAVAKSGDDCLTLASADTQLTALLFARGATPTVRALLGAIRHQNIPALEKLCTGVGANTRMPQHGPTGIDEKPGTRPFGFRGMHPLLYAATLGTTEWEVEFTGLAPKDIYARQLPVINTLLKHGANPFAVFVPEETRVGSGFGSMNKAETVLHHLLEKGGIAEPMLERPGLDIERRDAQGRTLLLAACCGKQSRMPVKRLGWQTAHESAHPSFIEHLLEAGASTFAQDSQDRNVLHLALQPYNDAAFASFRLLLSHSPSLINQRDQHGSTPLYYALRRTSAYSDAEMVAIEGLLHAGADPSVPDTKGNSPLHWLGAQLARLGWDGQGPARTHRLFRRLISAGVPINGRNDMGETPIFSFFLSQSKYPQGSYHDGDEERQRDALKLLDDVGADVLAVDNSGNNLMDVIASTDHKVREGPAGDMLEERFQWLDERGVEQSRLDVTKLKMNGKLKSGLKS